MGRNNRADLLDLGHPCSGSYLTAADDTSVGGVGEVSNGPGRLLSPGEGPPVGRVPNQSGATLYGRQLGSRK